jgi:hypothetical protein
MLEETSRALPAAVLHPTTALLFILLLRAVMKTPHASGRLLLVVVWLRYVMQAYHEITYQTVAGVSINAIASLAVCCIGGIVLFGRLADLRRFPLVIAMIAVAIVSGLMNGLFVAAIETALKWGYFIVVMFATLDCLKRDGDARILGLLLWAFAPPLVYQALSIGMGVSKATEHDGSISYIGGFNHEAAFSIVLVTCFAIASLAPRLNFAARMFLLTVCLAGVIAANYRTSLIAAAPIALGYFAFGIARGVRAGQRLAISIIGLVVVAGGVLAANLVLSERMADLAAVAEDPLIRPPEEFTVAEQKLLSGRLYIWNRYYDEYASGSDAQLLLGFGPDAWVASFGVYAHNTVVSHLYEFGLVGSALIILIWVAMAMRALAISDWSLRWQVFCAHAGFILLNMATMPFWMVEGLILYAVLCAYTVWLAPQRSHGPLVRRASISARRYRYLTRPS